MSATGDSVIVIGAASKGIIQRDHQHNVQVYKSQYAANPFENVDPNDIDTYRIEVERKTTGDSGEEPVGKYTSSLLVLHSYSCLTEPDTTHYLHQYQYQIKVSYSSLGELAWSVLQ